MQIKGHRSGAGQGRGVTQVAAPPTFFFGFCFWAAIKRKRAAIMRLTLTEPQKRIVLKLIATFWWSIWHGESRDPREPRSSGRSTINSNGFGWRFTTMEAAAFLEQFIGFIVVVAAVPKGQRQGRCRGLGCGRGRLPTFHVDCPKVRDIHM